MWDLLSALKKEDECSCERRRTRGRRGEEKMIGELEKEHGRNAKKTSVDDVHF